MRFASLGSGSRGNALIVEAGDTRVLLDCGFGPRELERRLARLGLASDDLAAVVLTHEHSDHVAGAAKAASRLGIPVYGTHGTLNACAVDGIGLDVCRIDSHASFSIGDLEIQPFPVPHDAREPVQYRFSDGARRLGVLTDTGFITPHIVEMLTGCDGLVLECNHDLEMLSAGPYPPRLQERIRGRYGHLDNEAAADLLRRIASQRLRHVVAAHLSEQNNSPDLARSALAGALGCTVDWIGLATQEDGFSWRSFAF